MEKIIIFGTGNISEIALLYLSEIEDYEVAGFTMDREYIKENEFKGLPIVSFEDIEEKFNPSEYKMFIPLSYSKVNKLREQKFNEAKKKGFSFISYVSPNTYVHQNVKIGENCFIFENNTIQPFVKIEDNCILWSGNHIGHHSVIKKNCFISSHVVISGGCIIEKNTFIGVNATLRDHITIGQANVIGAGALILSDTKENSVFMSCETEVSRVPSNKLRGI